MAAEEPVHWALASVVGYLASAGCDVVSFTRFDDAKHHLMSAALDILITDLRLGAFNGLQLVGRAKSRWPGITAEESGGEVRLTIPDRHRLGHENHFGEVASRFLEYVASPASVPAWEKPNMLVKYFVTTRGTELSHAER